MNAFCFAFVFFFCFFLFFCLFVCLFVCGGANAPAGEVTHLQRALVDNGVHDGPEIDGGHGGAKPVHVHLPAQPLSVQSGGQAVEESYQHGAHHFRDHKAQEQQPALERLRLWLGCIVG